MTTQTEGAGGSRQPFDPTAALADVARATDRFLVTAARLDDAAVREPSLLPGWTRGHVLSHVARNADGLVNLLTWARTEVETPQYASLAARDSDVELGAARTAGELVADVQDSAERFYAAVGTVPAEGWAVVVRWTAGNERRASAILTARMREVEIHHVDLDVDYTPAHWHVEFSGRVLDGATTAMTAGGDAPAVRLHAVDTDRTWALGAADEVSPQVSGPQAALLAWLIGRSSGDGLTVEPHDTPLPVPPPWA